MLEKAAASLEPCGLHRVIPGATQSFRTTRQLQNAFWQHGAADIELSATWQALMHGTLDLNLGSAPEEGNGSVLSASAFLLDFLYPSGAMNLMRRLTPAAPVSGRPGGFRYRQRFRKIMPRLYTSSLPKRQIHRPGSEGAADPKVNEPDSDVSAIRDDVTHEEDSQEVDSERIQSKAIQEADEEGDVLVDKEQALSGVDAEKLEQFDIDGDHITILEDLLKKRNFEDAERAWYHYKSLDEPSQSTYIRQVLLFLSKSDRLSARWRVSELFSQIPLSQWTNEVFLAGVTAEINLQNAYRALEIFTKGLEHQAIGLPPLIGAIDLLLATALRSTTLELLRDLWQLYPKMATRWDFEDISSYLRSAAPSSNLAVLTDVKKYYPDMVERWNFEGITSQLKHVALVPGLTEKVIEFATHGPQLLQEDDGAEISQDAFDSLQRILVRRALLSCTDDQVIPLLNLTKDPLAFEEFLRTATSRGKDQLGIEVYRIYRDLHGSVPSHPVLHEIFKAYNNLIVPASVVYAGVEMLWDDWHKFHTLPSFRAFQRYLTFYASRGDTEYVYGYWRKFIKSYRGDPKRPVLSANDIFSHLMQAHAVRGEVEETQRIFDQISSQFHLEHDAHHWNILLKAYVKAGDYDGAISVFESLVRENKWDRYSYGTMMQMSGARGDLGFTIDLYRQLLAAGGQADAAILGAIVDAYCRNDHMQSAEDVCIRAASKGIVDAQMWNKLLYYYAVRRDLANINKVLALMADKNITYNQYTYRQLLIGLSICRQSVNALNVLTTALRDNIFPVTAEHFHIVMSSLLVTGEPGAVLRLDKMMQDYGFPSSAQSLFLLTQTLGQFRSLPPFQRARLTPTEWLGEAFRSFYSIYGLRRKRLYLMQPGRRHSQAGELLQENTEKSHFSTMVSMLTELKDYAGAREIVDLYRYIFKGEEDPDGILPVAMLNSLMQANFREGKLGSVINTWELFFETAKKEARSADYVEELPHTPKVSAKYQYVLSTGLVIMQKLYLDRGDAASIQKLVREVREAGFELDSKNWNFNIQALVQLKEYKKAFATCEEMLMPNWTGWFVVRTRESVKNKLPLDLRRKGTSPRHLRPTATTLYHLTRGYMELDRLSVWSSDYAAALRGIEQECVQVVRAIKSMIRLRSRHEIEIIGEEDYADLDSINPRDDGFAPPKIEMGKEDEDDDGDEGDELRTP
ncbi:uncharacterized protein F4812DRAFT_284494 [Daldinia caldariorum]|uniref:uncharacterized protein n=1 Tax=Daldinia caldariorum TaxID=326644 RepID=UPI0020074FA6|nr:uncharacterized protein F4812DRAFT_284494 [Daldinia caldariorum]KAI1470973.1 hypothetical protein F4812DRAFT_284494 [Daldinia caldariorum]